MKITQNHCAKISKNGLTAECNCGIAVGEPQDHYSDDDVLFSEKDGARMTERLCWGNPFIIIKEKDFLKEASKTQKDLFVLFDDFSKMRGAFLSESEARKLQKKIFDNENVLCNIEKTKLNSK